MSTRRWAQAIRCGWGTFRRAAWRTLCAAPASATALIGDADGDDTGPYRPALLFLPAPDVVADGTVPDPTAPGGKREDPARLWAATQAAFQTCDLVVVHFGDFARAERENQRGFLLPAAYQAHRERALQALDAYLGLVLNRLSRHDCFWSFRRRLFCRTVPGTG